MAVILTSKRPWIRQPDYPVELDHNHPFLGKLLIAKMVQGHTWLDLLGQPKPSVIGSTSLVAARGGYRCIESDATSSGFIDLGALTVPTAEISLCGILSINASASADFVLSSLSSTGNGIGIRQASSTTMTFKAEASGGTDVFTGSLTYAIGIPFIFLGSVSASEVNFYSNSQIATPGSNTFTNTTLSGSQNLRIGSRGTAYRAVGSPIILAHNRVISLAEYNDWRANPWQILKPRKQISYFDVSGGATDTPSDASSGSFSITGSAANGTEAKLSAASSSSYTLTGSNAAGLIARASAAGSSSYTITGVAASGVKQAAGDTPSAASSGSFTISGVAASGVRALKAAADSSSYTLTGSNANGLVSIGADASSGSYTITGVAAEGQWIHVSDASSNAFVITGVDATGVKSGAISLTQADLDAIAAAVWADATAVAAHAKLDAIIARLTC